MMTTNEQQNWEEIPNEIKENLNVKTKSVMNTISILETQINTAIDDAVESIIFRKEHGEEVDTGAKVSISQIQAALINVMLSFSKREITNLIQ